jgi:hypothetical protein
MLERKRSKCVMDEPRQSPILLDVAPGGDGEFDRSFLEKLGHPVSVCHGPAANEQCPILSGQRCPLFEEAHGVVYALDLDRPDHRAILDRYCREARPDLPIRVVVRPGQAERYAALLADVQMWEHEPSVADLDGFAAEVEATDR